ncbi:MAG: Calx-beta domain-containing protein [Candidatus Cryptobacteroides sp.]
MLAAAVATLASCDLNKTPVFEDSRSFAAFDKTAITVNEDAGLVTIPVTIASIDPKKVAVAYSVTDGEGKTGAKLGVNYKLTDESAVVAFDGQTRTMNIEIEIINYVGYTGDLTFTVDLVSAGGLEIGANSSCTVRISDLDHPLASILGTYAASGKENWDGDITWDITIDKDPSSIEVVWIYNISPGMPAVYGNVIKDGDNIVKISIPCGQEGKYSSYKSIFVGFKTGGYYSPEGTIDFEKTSTGWETTDPDWGYGFLAADATSGELLGWLTGLLPTIKFTKK